MTYCAITGKVTHGSQHGAQAACRANGRRHKAVGHAYRCPHCSGWHITKQLTEVKPAFRKRR